MSAHYPVALAKVVAESFRYAREESVARRLDRINAQVTVDIDKICPTADLLNHVPLLVDGIARPFEELMQMLVLADVVVCSTASTRAI